MTAPNRPTRRVAIALALAAGAALTLSACGSGQISQTATQVAAINGNNVDAGDIVLRNVHVVYPADGSGLRPGSESVLAFTVVNQSAETTDTLRSIRSDHGTVTGVNSIAIAPQTALASAAPGEDTEGATTTTSAAPTTTPAGGETTSPTTTAAEGTGTDESPRPAQQGTRSGNQTVDATITGISDEVRPGLTVTMTFDFEKAGPVEIEVPVDAGPVLPRRTPAEQASAGGGH